MGSRAAQGGVYVVFMARRTTAAAFGFKPDAGNTSLSFVLHGIVSWYVSFIQNIIWDLNMESSVVWDAGRKKIVFVTAVCLASAFVYKVINHL